VNRSGLRWGRPAAAHDAERSHGGSAQQKRPVACQPSHGEEPVGPGQPEGRARSHHDLPRAVVSGLCFCQHSPRAGYAARRSAPPAVAQRGAPVRGLALRPRPALTCMDCSRLFWLTRGCRPRTGLLMRLGFAPFRGSNPRASAPDLGARASPAGSRVLSVIIPAPRWHIGGTSGRGCKDPVDRGSADSGELVHPVLGHASVDGPPDPVVPVPGHHDPLGEHLLGLPRRHVHHATCSILDSQRSVGIAAGSRRQAQPRFRFPVLRPATFAPLPTIR
jgi:hypothetical protein